MTVHRINIDLGEGMDVTVAGRLGIAIDREFPGALVITNHDQPRNRLIIEVDDTSHPDLEADHA